MASGTFGGPNDRWDAARVRALRQYLRVSQRALAEEMGVRQQTVSEWETGLYAPRGASARLLSIVAEGAGFPYRTAPGETLPSPPPARR